MNNFNFAQHRPGVDPKTFACMKENFVSARQGIFIPKTSDLGAVYQEARDLAKWLMQNGAAVHEALANYASYPAVEDEIQRSIDLLSSLQENEAYLGLKGGVVATFMPRNQLLYSLLYLGIVPSFVSTMVHIHPPMSAEEPMRQLINILPLESFCKGVDIQFESHSDFSNRVLAGADFVLFAGTYRNALRVKKRMNDGAILIFNGAGHNPITVGRTANIRLACNAIISTSFHNQGQDCAAPNAVLVHADIYDAVKDILIEATRGLTNKMSLGRHPDNVISHNTDLKHTRRVAHLFQKRMEQILIGGRVDLDSGMIEPTVMEQDLQHGPNYTEFFAPIVLLQRYESKDELNGYFDTREYRRKAMYITAFAEDEEIAGWPWLMNASSQVILNSDLHVVERGTVPYGGFGPEASSLMMGENVTPTPILPHREIGEFLLAMRHNSRRTPKFDAGETAKGNDVRMKNAEDRATIGAPLQELHNKNIDPYPSVSLEKINAKTLQNKYSELENGMESEDQVTVAGRIMSIRNSGMFMGLRDGSGDIQIYSNIKNDATKAKIESFGIGDFVTITGPVRRTRRGELTVDVETSKLLSKSLRALPEKYHGLRDVEARYRQRYLDILSNTESRERFHNRTRLLGSVRETLEKRDFMEVETPMMHPIYGGAAARPFVTHHNVLDMDLYLRIAPELYLKQLLVSGLSERVYEINRNFRNEGISTRHNPEFTMLEAYQAYADFGDMMDLVEAVICDAALVLHDTYEITYQGKHIDLSPPFDRRPMTELVEEATGVDFLQITSNEESRVAVKSLSCVVKGDETWGECVALVFEEFVEGRLINPTHVTDFPAGISPLSKRRKDDPRFAERFETYINGWEIGNAFSELNDPVLQRQIMEEQLTLAHSRGEFDRRLDNSFITALEYGMPPAAGLGIGIDRVCMLLTDAPSIRDVILFPTLRHQKDR